MTLNLNHEECLRLCSNGELGVLRDLLRPFNRTDIESIRDKYNASCLHYAARAGFVNVLEYLIGEKNVSPFLVSEIGATCLHDAAVKGKLNVIEWVIKNTSLNTSFKDSNGATIMHLAAKFDQIEIIDWLLRLEGVKSLKQQTFNGATCIHFASGTNSFKCLRRLLQFVPSLVNIQMMNGVTPIYLAAQEDNLPLVKYLIRMGANVFLRANDGMNVLHVACQNGNLDLVDILYRDFNANLNDRDYNGASPLHYACINGNPALVAYLLSNGAKIMVDKFGNTALHDAAVGGYIECARLLIASDCDASARDNQDMTSADIAESYGHMEFARELRKFERASILKQKMAYEKKQNPSDKEDKETTIEDINQNEKGVTETTGVNNNNNNSHNSVTSPIFNSLAVVTTSTPSAAAAAAAQSDDLNNTANSINNKKTAISSSNNSSNSISSSSNEVTTTTAVTSNKIELNIQNGRPATNPLSASVTHSRTTGGSSTLKLFIKRQDFSAVQLKDDGQVAPVTLLGNQQYRTIGSTTPHRYVQSPNANTFGRTKKSLDLITNDESESKVSALEELDKCIAEFDRDTFNLAGTTVPATAAAVEVNTSQHDLSTSRSITGVTDLSTSQVVVSASTARTPGRSMASFSMENETSTTTVNKIMESTGTSTSESAGGGSQGANLSSIVSLSRNDDVDVDDDEAVGNKSRFISPDLNNNSNITDANSRVFKVNVSNFKGASIPPPPPPLPPAPVLNVDYRNFMLKPVKNYGTDRFGRKDAAETFNREVASSNSGTGENKKYENLIDELQKNIKNGTLLLKQQRQQSQQRWQQQQQQQQPPMMLSRSSSSNVIMRYDPNQAGSMMTTTKVISSTNQIQPQLREGTAPPRSNEIIRRISEIKSMSKQASTDDLANIPEWKRQLIEKKKMRNKIIVTSINA